MKYVSLLAIAACGLTAGCSIKTERTVVEKPAPTSTVVYTEPAPAPAPTVVYVPR